MKHGSFRNKQRKNFIFTANTCGSLSFYKLKSLSLPSLHWLTSWIDSSATLQILPAYNYWYVHNECTIHKIVPAYKSALLKRTRERWFSKFPCALWTNAQGKTSESMSWCRFLAKAVVYKVAETSKTIILSAFKFDTYPSIISWYHPSAFCVKTKFSRKRKFSKKIQEFQDGTLA